MLHNRLQQIMPPPPQPAFLMIPLACLPPLAPPQWLYQQALYQWAFDEAQKVVRPSILERDLLGVWN